MVRARPAAITGNLTLTGFFPYYKGTDLFPEDPGCGRMNIFRFPGSFHVSLPHTEPSSGTGGPLIPPASFHKKGRTFFTVMTL
jgi:hypothetical protein